MFYAALIDFKRNATVIKRIERKKSNTMAKEILKDLIEYQMHSIVSKTLIRKNSGSVTLFAFGRGQGLSEHSAPFDAIAVSLTGKGDIVIDGDSNIIKEGEMVIIPSNATHAIKALEPFKMMLVMIK